jgi:2-dehydro-3-deoxyphosphogluconate aldolase/(4S)-4-hydroxy-2-oxoglutarate aldolase
MPRKSTFPADMQPNGIVAVLRGSDPGRVEDIARALMDGGVRFIEITLTVPSARQLITRLGSLEEGVIGAGTVTSAEQAAEAIASGARFLVAPACRPAVAEEARKHGVPCLLGAMTPTEVLAAWEAGANQVKVFPIARLGGPRYVLDLEGPYPQIPLSPSGGITVADLPNYRLPNVVSVGIGSELAPVGLAVDEIRERARRAVAAFEMD